MQQETNQYQPPSQIYPPPTPQQNFGKTQKKENWKSTLSTIFILVTAPLIALLLTAFVFQSYEVDGPSMENTLQNHDRLIVWKLPRSIARITHKTYIPKRGDIVIFIMHGIEKYDPNHDRQLIKRVIALPGERVVVRDDLITVFNATHPEGFNPDLIGNYHPVDTSSEINIDLVVPEGEIFVSGDNRPNSLDSRTFGPVPAKDIVGTLAYRIFPIDNARAF